MKRSRIAAVLSLLALAASSASAQPSEAARLRYEQTIAQCDGANLPRPERNACIRDAGDALARAGGGQPAVSPDTIPDTRSTVIAPDGTQRSGDDSDSTYTTRDGRAVVVPPAKN
ncbi:MULTISPECIES: hypothetical protein [unclassified Variovorax]|uniref:hypothetical protein n=1 Tax=unclassified Variovorax TaxID=663243 RepID=UPI001BD21D73|nr:MULTISPECIES: hypothetical protein [unclassified Variovorax]